MTRSIAVWIVAGVVCSMGCTEPGSRSPRRDTGTVTPEDDAGSTTPREDTGPIVFPDSGPPVDGGPADHDNDGIPDDSEGTYGTDPNDADSDHDGITDGVEVLAGTNPTDASSTIPPTDFYVVLPFGDAPQHRNLDFTARLGRADVYFLIDTTGSMGLAIMNVRSSLRDTIVPAIQGAIADAVMGVGDFRDYNDGATDGRYGGTTDYTYQNRQSMTPDVTAIETALNALRVGDGDDGPESSTEALYLAAAGTCAGGGGFGAACFRDASHPIIVHVSDAPFHNGPTPANDYPASFGLHTWSEMTAALNAGNVKVVGAAIGTFGIFAGQSDQNALAMATGSRAADGSTTVYRAMGGNVSTTVVNGIVDLVGAATQDVSARSLDDTSDGLDATQFIKAITPVMASRSIDHMDATTFYGVPGGTTVTFDVEFWNDFQPGTAHVQLYRAYIEVFDVATGVALDRRNVYIVIPGENGSILI